jgi:hypothetical protein
LNFIDFSTDYWYISNGGISHQWPSGRRSNSEQEETLMTVELLKEYDTAIDGKHRITVRGGSRRLKYKNYHVRIFNDGRVLLEPRILVDPKLISKRTLTMMDRAMSNYAKGSVSEPVDLKKMNEIADALPD